MRMRKKPNLIPRMEKCGQVQIKEPEKLRGAWRAQFPDFGALWLEIGCGKGDFPCHKGLATPLTLMIEEDS